MPPWHRDALGQCHRAPPHPSHGCHSWVRAQPRPAGPHCSPPVPALRPSRGWGLLQCRGGWEGPRQQSGDAQDRPGPATTRARSCTSAGPPWADTDTPAPVAPQNPQLLTNSCSPSCPTPQEHLNTGAGGPSAMRLQACWGSEAGRVPVVLRPGLPGVLCSNLSLWRCCQVMRQ